MPRSTSAFTFWRPLPNRYWKIGISRPVLAASASARVSQSRSDATSGFSHTTCLPAARAAVICSRWSDGGVQRSTMSTSSRSIASSKVTMSAPVRSRGVGGAGLVGVGDGRDREAVLHASPRPHVHLADAEPDDGDLMAPVGVTHGRASWPGRGGVGRGAPCTSGPGDSSPRPGRCAAPWCSR